MRYRSKLFAPLFAAAVLLATAPQSIAQSAPVSMSARPGWIVLPTPHKFATLSERLDQSIKANKMGIVTVASASQGAKAQGFEIPGNKVVGVFRNDFARRMLAASVPAGIEAPIRFYLTENADGTATLSYKKPSDVFRPYTDDSSSDLGKIGKELDGVFAKIAEDAAKRE